MPDALLQEVLFGNNPAPLELFFFMITGHDQEKEHLRWRATELRFYGSEEEGDEGKITGTMDHPWNITKKSSGLC